ncbi:hypothetical protein NDU88_000989 [Pleurodeles waltl]|uniref:Uncharacterized protein n=1 Tax=Pleurodeles waltl TaxID=8319 RepID=A0AAV7U821_PLEWA|nr:hypothetical protein NDU88_000989 [Pleurodeles waltl]
MLSNIPRPGRPEQTDEAVRPGPDGKEMRTRASEEPSGPTIAAAAPCAQVRNDPSAAGGDGEEPRTHPRMP